VHQPPAFHLNLPRANTLAGAGCVRAPRPDHPRLRALKNVVLLSHMGSATVEGRDEMGEKVIINIKTFADGHRLPDLVVLGMCRGYVSAPD